MLIAIPCEKNQREALGSRKPIVTGLTGPADRSDRSGPTASLFELTGLAGLGEQSDRSDSDRASASF